LNPTKADCDPKKEKKKTHNTEAEDHPKQGAGSGGKGPTTRTAALEGHALTPAPPRRRSDAERPEATEIGQKKAARGPHSHQTTESPLAHGHHALVTGYRQDRILRRKGRKTTENAAGGRVSVRSWRGRADLASKIKKKKKVKERAKKHPADDTKARPFPQRRQLEINNPTKQKKQTKKDT
jgi:hypothetical protein